MSRGKIYEDRYKEPFGPYASKASEWAKTIEAKALEAERENAKTEFNRANKDNAEKTSPGNTLRNKELDDLQKNLLSDFQLTSDAVRKAQKAFDDQTAKEAAKTNTPPETTTPPKPHTGIPEGVPINALTFDFTGQSPLQSITLGQTLELQLKYGNGHGPFRIVVVTPKIVNRTLPPPVVVTPKIVNQQLLTPLVGSYRAILVIGYHGKLNPGFPFAKKSLPVLDTPVRITFEPSGTITGVCDYTFPDSGFGPKSQTTFDRVGWKTKFTLNGTVDWTTGKMELTIPDGRIDYYFVSGDDQNDYAIEYAATFRGRHITDPFWPVHDRNYFLNNTAPKIVALSEAGELIGDGDRASDIWGHRIAQTPDPGIITAEIDWKKKTVKHKSLNLTRDEKLDTEREENAYSVKHGGVGWQLKLLGLDTTVADLAKAELVATSLWPDRVTTATVGETIFSKFVGVFSDDYTKLRELNDLATWQVPAGLAQIRPGVFRAEKSGKYEVNVKAKGKSGTWMEGFLTINVMGP